MQCSICGHDQAYIRKIDRTYGKGQHTIVIRDISLAICSICDARYFAPNIFDKAKPLSPPPQSEVKNSDALCLA